MYSADQDNGIENISVFFLGLDEALSLGKMGYWDWTGDMSWCKL